MHYTYNYIIYSNVIGKYNLNKYSNNNGYNNYKNS